VPTPKPKGKPPATGKRGAKDTNMNERTANWPGPPGPTQPRDRSGGVKRVKQSAKSEGL
jgi:hypothetical protein